MSSDDRSGPNAGERVAPPPSSVGSRIASAIVRLLGGLSVLLLVIVALVYVASEKRFRRRFDVYVAPVVFPQPSDASAVAEGERLAATRGCVECHGAHGEGRLLLDQMPILEVRPPNLTKGGATERYTNEDWARAVRTCVRPDGSPLLFMPCEDYAVIDDVDLGRIVAFLRGVPASTYDPGTTRIGPLGRALFLAGELPLLAAERVPPVESVPRAPRAARTAEYGEYLAHGCTGCHGTGLSGGKIPGVPPEWPAAANLTPDPSSAFAGYSEADFVAFMREGRKPTGARVDPTFMPWRQFARLDDVELGAIFAYLKTVPPKSSGGR